MNYALLVFFQSHCLFSNILERYMFFFSTLSILWWPYNREEIHTRWVMVVLIFHLTHIVDSFVFYVNDLLCNCCRYAETCWLITDLCVSHVIVCILPTDRIRCPRRAIIYTQMPAFWQSMYHKHLQSSYRKRELVDIQWSCIGVLCNKCDNARKVNSYRALFWHRQNLCKLQNLKNDRSRPFSTRKPGASTTTCSRACTRKCWQTTRYATTYEWGGEYISKVQSTCIGEGCAIRLTYCCLFQEVEATQVYIKECMCWPESAYPYFCDPRNVNDNRTGSA